MVILSSIWVNLPGKRYPQTVPMTFNSEIITSRFKTNFLLFKMVLVAFIIINRRIVLLNNSVFTAYSIFIIFQEWLAKKNNALLRLSTNYKSIYLSRTRHCTLYRYTSFKLSLVEMDSGEGWGQSSNRYPSRPPRLDFFIREQYGLPFMLPVLVVFSKDHVRCLCIFGSRCLCFLLYIFRLFLCRCRLTVWSITSKDASAFNLILDMPQLNLIVFINPPTYSFSDCWGSPSCFFRSFQKWVDSLCNILNLLAFCLIE